MSRPEHLHDFDVDFALFNLRKRRATLGGLSVWSPARWQNVVILVFGLAALLGFYVIPALYWREIVSGEGSRVGMVLGAVVLAVLFLPIVAMMLGGLTHWPRLIVDRKRRTLTVQQLMTRRIVARVGFDEIGSLETDHLFSEEGTEVTGPFEVLYAELKDGRLVGIAGNPSAELIREMRNLI